MTRIMTRAVVPTAALVLAACAGSAEVRTELSASEMARTYGDATSVLREVKVNDHEVSSILLTVLRTEAHIDDEWVVLTDNAVTVDLIELLDDDNLVVDHEFLPSGHYTQARMILSDESWITVDDEELPLTVPSGPQTGLKIPFEYDLDAGETYAVVFDFVADQSLHSAADRWVLRPVLQVGDFTMIEVEDDTDN